MDTPLDSPTSADPQGDGAPEADPMAVPAAAGLPAPGETVAMSQVAGDRPTALVADEPKKKKKKEKGDTVPMSEAGPSAGALSPADQALADLGTKRGIETIFRTSYRVNMDLSSLADAKANIMISINGLIISILIASIAPGMEKNPWLLIPTSLFLIGCLVSLVFAVLAARPRVQSQVVTKESALKNRTNILFFGNFSHLSQGDFVDVLKEVVMDPTQTYEMMMKDIYGVGSVLQKKYKMLRASYGAFLVALIVGVVGFIGVFAWTQTLDPGPDTIYINPTAPVSPGVGTPGILP